MTRRARARKGDRAEARRPVVNDHLGDAYWRTGRKLEAHFQWNHAREWTGARICRAILKKIDSGLPDVRARRAGRARRRKRMAAEAEWFPHRAAYRSVWRAPAKVNLTLHILVRREEVS